MEKTNKQAKRNIVKIVLTGPESTGKSTLAKGLAKHYNTVWVEEYLREFAEEKYSKNEELIYTDNLLIAKGQMNLEQEAIKHANKYIFCDTDILQTVIYSNEYYNKVQPTLKEKLQTSSTSLYLLLNLDVSWEEDHLRDKPNDRIRMFNIIEETLIKFNKKYAVIEGDGDIRLHNAINTIEKHFNKQL